MRSYDIIYAILLGMTVLLELGGLLICLLHTRYSARLWMIFAGLLLLILAQIGSFAGVRIGGQLLPHELLKWLFTITALFNVGARLLILDGVILLIFDFRRRQLAVHALDGD